MKDESKKVAEIYDRISSDYARVFSKPSDHIDDFLELVPRGGRILDAGCGPGVDSAYVFARGFKIIGVDLSAKMLELARRRNPNIRFRQMDMRALDFGQESFDGVLASYSLIHVPKKDVPGVIKNFLKVLKSGGILCIGIQEGEAKEISIPEPFRPDKKIFVNVISAEELRQLLRDGGFTVLREFRRGPERGGGLEFDFDKFVLVAKK